MWRCLVALQKDEMSEVRLEAVMTRWLSLVWAVTMLNSLVSSAEPEVFFRKAGGLEQSSGQKLPSNLATKAAVVWEQSLLPGNSTPCIHGDSVYVTTWNAEEKQLAIVSLDKNSGRRLWTRVLPPTPIERVHPVGSPASASPACDGERVYAFFGSYGLVCCDLKGHVLWSKALGPFQDEFGAASSPILLDDLVILNEDHDVDSFVIAINKLTGETVWRQPRGEFTRSYSTPVVWEHGGQKLVVIAGSLKLVAYDPSNGKPVWWVRGLSRIVDTTPVIFGDRLFLATWTPGGDQAERISMPEFAEGLKLHDKNGDGAIGRDELPKDSPVTPRFFRMDTNLDQRLTKPEWDRHRQVFALAQNAAIAVRPGGRGDVTDTHVDWVYRRGLPTVPSPVVYQGVMYMVKDSGVITALDAETGRLIKQLRARGRGNYYASPVAGDGKVYFLSERGVLTVIRSGQDPTLVSSHDFAERIMATPVVHQGRFYVRTDQFMRCFSGP